MTTAAHENDILKQHVSQLKRRFNTMKFKHKSATLSDKELSLENHILGQKVKEFEDAVNFLETGTVPSIVTKVNGRFVDNVRTTCMQLACSYDVSVRKVSAVINMVLKNLAGVDVDASSFPCKSTIENLFREANVIAKHHCCEKMSEGFDINDQLGNVSHSDATSKFHKRYQSNETTTKKGETLVIGLSEVAGGDGDTYTAVFKECMEDLADSSLLNTEETKNKLTASFKAFMSDSCAVNGVLFKNIHELREEAIHNLVPDFNSLPQKDQDDALFMVRHSCRMHLIANFATAADKGVAAFETAVSSGVNPHAFRSFDQSGTLRLIRTAAKAFCERGCDKSGVNQFFEPHLHSISRKNQLLTFLVHRFNISFTNGATVNYHLDDINSFFQQFPNPNQLLQSVSFDIRKKVYTAGCRAYGIMAKKVTEHFLVVIRKNKILDMIDDLELLKSTLQAWAADASPAFCEGPIFKYDYLKNSNNPVDSIYLPKLEIMTLMP